MTQQQQLSVPSVHEISPQQLASYQKHRGNSQKKINYPVQQQPQQPPSENVRENRLLNQNQQRVVREAAGSVVSQGLSVSGNFSQPLENHGHAQNSAATNQISKSTTRFAQKNVTNGNPAMQPQAIKGGQIVQAGHTPQSAQSMDQRQQLNHQNGAAYGSVSANYGTRSMNQQVRAALSSQQKPAARSTKQESSIANIDSSSQSSMSTHAKAWDVKGQAPGRNQAGKLDGQNTGKCVNCKYRVSKQERILYDCRECGNYLICQYCFDDFLEKNYQQTKGSSAISNISLSDDSESNSDMPHENANADKKDGKATADNKQSSIKACKLERIKCILCWSKKTLTDVCVKSMKSFGFVSPKPGQTRIPISTLSKEKVRKLANLRVIQKTLVYVIGLAPDIAAEAKIRSLELFGQYGKIEKVVINTNNVYNGSRGGPSYSGYITFNNPRDSAKAILAVDQFLYKDRLIRASFGTSKFCQFFLSGQKCTNKDCLYLHELRSDLEAYTKEDMQNNKIIFQEQQKIAIKLSRALEMNFDQFKQFNIENNQKLKEAYAASKNFKHDPILPKADIIFEKNYHFMNESLLEKQLRKQKKQEDRLVMQEKNAQKADVQQLRQNQPIGNKINESKFADNEANPTIENKTQETLMAQDGKQYEAKLEDAAAQGLELQEQLKSDEKDKTSNTITMSNHAKVVSLIAENLKDQQTQNQNPNDLKERDREHPKVQVKEAPGVGPQKQNNVQQQAQQKNQKGQKPQLNPAGNSVTIQLHNLKDLQHHQIDRSLSKIRIQNKGALNRISENDTVNEALNTSNSNVATNSHTALQAVLQTTNNAGNTNAKEETNNKHSKIEKLQISPEMSKGINDPVGLDPKKEITSLNLNQDSIQVSHVAQRPAIKESGRFQVKLKKKTDLDDNVQCVPVQRLNNHQVEQKLSPRDQQKQHIKETTSVDARQLGLKFVYHQHQIQADANARAQAHGQKSQERIESIFTDMFSGNENFNMTLQTSKTLETSKNKDTMPNVEYNSVGGKMTNGFFIGDFNNTTLSKTTYSWSDQQIIKAAAQQFMMNNHIFQKKKESRFKFAHQVAHSMDPLQANQKMIDDDEEILVPKNIQDLIERGIRTLSNSISTVKSNVNDIQSTAAQEAQEEMATGIKIKTLNKMLQQEQDKVADTQLQDIKELKERWYTRKELNKVEETQSAQVAPSLISNQQHLLSPSPVIKGSAINAELSTEPQVVNPSSNIGGTSYNVTRVKYQVKQNPTIIEEEKGAMPNGGSNAAQNSDTQQQNQTRHTRRNKNKNREHLKL